MPADCITMNSFSVTAIAFHQLSDRAFFTRSRSYNESEFSLGRQLLSDFIALDLNCIIDVRLVCVINHR